MCVWSITLLRIQYSTCMYVCMCACMYACICGHICKAYDVILFSLYVCVVYNFASNPILNLYVCMYVCMCACMYACICGHICKAYDVILFSLYVCVVYNFASNPILSLCVCMYLCTYVLVHECKAQNFDKWTMSSIPAVGNISRAYAYTCAVAQNVTNGSLVSIPVVGIYLVHMHTPVQ
jgi:hypothetical protein